MHSAKRTAARLAAAAAFVVAATLAVTVAVTVAACTIERVGDGDTEGTAEPDFLTLVTGILDAQAAAWNRGDLDGFMATYDRSPETTYIGATGLITGFDGIRARYAPLFEEGAERDSVRFTDLDARPLDPRFGLVTARYVLFRGGQTTSTGPFTLILMHVEGAWMIVHDQSAADPQ